MRHPQTALIEAEEMTSEAPLTLLRDAGPTLTVL
jgi:hypothetical protein